MGEANPPPLLFALIHPSAWKANSANFAFSYRVQQAAEKTRRRQLVEAGGFRQRISIVDAKKGNTTHIDLTPAAGLRTQDWHT